MPNRCGSESPAICEDNYQHHYMIPEQIITLAKQIKEHSEACRGEDERSRKEEERTSLIKLIVDMQAQITILSGELSETRDDLKAFRSISNLTSSTGL